MCLYVKTLQLSTTDKKMKKNKKKKPAQITGNSTNENASFVSDKSLLQAIS